MGLLEGRARAKENAEGARKRTKECVEEEAADNRAREKKRQGKSETEREVEKEVDFGCERSTRRQ